MFPLDMEASLSTDWRPGLHPLELRAPPGPDPDAGRSKQTAGIPSLPAKSPEAGAVSGPWPQVNSSGTGAGGSDPPLVASLGLGSPQRGTEVPVLLSKDRVAMLGLGHVSPGIWRHCQPLWGWHQTRQLQKGSRQTVVNMAFDLTPDQQGEWAAGPVPSWPR